MTEEQADILIDLIETEAYVAAQDAVNQPAPKYHSERIEELRQRLRDSTRGE